MLVLAGLVWSGAVKAAGLEFRYQGEAVEDNGTVTIQSQEDSWGLGEMNCETNPVSDPANGLVLVTASGNRSGTAVLTILSNTLDAKTVQWCMGGTCTLMTTQTQLEKSFMTGEDGVAQVQFDASNIRQEGSLKALLTATVGGETRTVNIVFVHSLGTGIASLKEDGCRQDCYRLDGTKLGGQPLKKGVYVVNGKKVVR